MMMLGADACGNLALAPFVTPNGVLFCSFMAGQQDIKKLGFNYAPTFLVTPLPQEGH
jgi:hypothetical protein